MNSTFLNHLKSPKRPVLVFDGATGTSLQSQNLTAEDFGGPEYELDFGQKKFVSVYFTLN